MTDVYLTDHYKISVALDGGRVQRTHTQDHHGRYTNAEHSYNALSLLLVLHPGPSYDLVKAVLWHDVAEQHVGDMPANAKWSNLALALEYERVEAEFLRDNLNLDMRVLNAEEEAWLHTVDKLEYLLWCNHQLALGNALIEHEGRANVVDWFEKNWGNIPADAYNVIERAIERGL